jgi:hypothetical protein
MSDPLQISCDGWWQQVGLGRQRMRELRLRFDGGRISGLGQDIVGAFTLAGEVRENGQVTMIKHYLGRHTVEYVGSYDGEGTLFGDWRCGGMTDRWRIWFKPAKGAVSSEAIAEVV